MEKFFVAEITLMEKFIVAEITKNWTRETPVTNLLCQQFEAVINTNDQRGYSLKDWRLTSVVHEGQLTETIIAIFQKKEP